MKEDFVTYEIAVKLREKGFNLDTDFCYNQEGCIVRVGSCLAPTISQVLKWLREEKKIHIAIDIWGRTWGYDIIKLTSGNSLHWTAYNENINNYEQAAIAGIEYVIDNLI